MVLSPALVVTYFWKARYSTTIHSFYIKVESIWLYSDVVNY